MTAAADAIIEEVIRREGGYVDHPADRGGPTKYGITATTLAQWLGVSVVSRDAVRALSIEDARLIYRSLYVRPFNRFSATPDLLSFAVDSAVQHGVTRTQAWLRAIPSADPLVNYRGLMRARLKFYGELITRDPTQAVFAKGWMSRLSEFVR